MESWFLSVIIPVTKELEWALDATRSTVLAAVTTFSTSSRLLLPSLGSRSLLDVDGNGLLFQISKIGNSTYSQNWGGFICPLLSPATIETSSQVDHAAEFHKSWILVKVGTWSWNVRLSYIWWRRIHYSIQMSDSWREVSKQQTFLCICSRW